MRTALNVAKMEPDEFAAQVAGWLEVRRRRDEAPQNVEEARAAAIEAMQSASLAGRQEHFKQLAQRSGVAAMDFAAEQGLADVIRQLAAAGADVNISLKKLFGITPLMLAAEYGHVDAVNALLDCGANPVASAAGMTALGIALKMGQRDVVDVLLNRSGDISSLKWFRGTLLAVVAQENRPEYVEALVNRGVSPDKSDEFNVTPLLLAAEKGHLEVVEALLRAGAAVEGTPTTPEQAKANPFLQLKDTPLVRAAKNGHTSVVRMLLAAGARWDVVGDQNMASLDWAKKNGHSEIVSLLRDAGCSSADALNGYDLLKAATAGDGEGVRQALAAGVDVDFCDKPSHSPDGKSLPGRTALMQAVVSGHLEVVRTLLKAGASVELQEKKLFSDGGQTAIELAAVQNRPEVLDLLLHSASPPDEKHLARVVVGASRAGALESVGYLLDSGTKVDARGPERTTPLMAAAGVGDVEMVRLLLKHGAEPDLKSGGQFGHTALLSAIIHLGIREKKLDEQGNRILVEKGDAKTCIQLLLEAGASVNVLTKNGDSPLAESVRYPEVVALMLKAGAAVNTVRSRDLTSALHWAVLWRVPESVRLLLAAGADVTAVDKKGQSPLDIAVERKYEEIAKLLRDAGAKAGEDTTEGRKAKKAAAAENRKVDERRQAAIEASERLRPDFSAAIKKSNYKMAVKKLEELCSKPGERAEWEPALLYCAIARGKAEEIQSAEFDAFQKLGCYLFLCGRATQDDADDLLAILPTTDQFEVVATMGTNGVNDDIFTSDVIAGLHKISEMSPFRVTKASHNTIQGEYLKVPVESKKLAKLLYELCPDIVDQGHGTIRKLESSLKKSRKLYLWWD